MLSVGKSGGEQKLYGTSLSWNCGCHAHIRNAPLRSFSGTRVLRWMWHDTDSTVHWHPPNIKYISGTFRTLLKLVICLTPGGQGIFLCEEGVEHLIFLPLCFAICGILTNRKNAFYTKKHGRNLYQVPGTSFLRH